MTEEGYKLVFHLADNWTQKGLLSVTAPILADAVNVTIINVGREIVEIPVGSILGTLWVEPHLEADWISAEEINQ